MRILAIETSAQTASAAVLTEEKLLAENTINHKMTHSELLMPMVDALLERLGLFPADLDAVAVCSGPGSFTGLRIGAATAKGLCAGLGIPLLPVPTLDALAYNIFSTDKIVCPMMDARREQVYAAFYEWNRDRLVKLSEDMALSFEALMQKAEAFGREVVFLGDGMPVFQEALKEKPFAVLAPPSLSMQRAASVGALALCLSKEGKAVNGSRFAPFYLRKPQAEREREERLSQEP